MSSENLAESFLLELFDDDEDKAILRALASGMPEDELLKVLLAVKDR